MERARLDTSVINQQAGMLADYVADTGVNHTKLALVSFGAIATGGTLRGIKRGGGLNHRQAPLGTASTGIFKRQVTAPKAFKFIVSGRRAGAKMPIRLVGRGKRGGKIFEPLPALITWFTALGIPKAAWFPILRAISRRGILPKNVPERAVRGMMPAVRQQAGLVAGYIARGIVKVNVS